MKNFVKALGAAALFTGMATTGASAADADLVKGFWLTGDQGQVVEIKACDEGSSRLCGDVVWAPAGTPEETLVLLGLRPSRANLSKGHFWNKGKVIDLASGKKRGGSIELLEDGTLKVDSCKRNLCKSQIWERPSAEMAELPEHIRLASR
ncbi:DUF2147 domain-containing protein [Kordiimonas lipolytica]|uniref:DUF2147 domain-containing protein n=1 Tax=Kordiimonas lipolytica TaxID=1662421 RepID=A0ABV8UA97_9PROT|nr:DUF2147 domain-containing protein [Kordiimonas lipolytica]